MTKGVKNAPKTAEAGAVGRKDRPRRIRSTTSSAKVEPEAGNPGGQDRRAEAAASAGAGAKAQTSGSEARRGQACRSKTRAEGEAREEAGAEDRSDRRNPEEGRGEEEGRRARAEAKKKVAEERAAKAKPAPRQEQKQARPTTSSKIAALLDKRTRQRQAAAGDQLNPNPGMRQAANGNAAVLSAERARRAAQAAVRSAGIRRWPRSTPERWRSMMRDAVQAGRLGWPRSRCCMARRRPYGRRPWRRAPCARS